MPPACYDVPPSITDIAVTVNTYTNKASPDQLIEKLIVSLSFSDSQITEIEKATSNQASSKVWWDQWKGRITASHFHDVHTKIQGILWRKDKVIKSRVTPLVLTMIKPKKNSLDWGKQNEINAAEAFMKQEGIHHINPKPLPSGLVISKSHPYIGGTPDNIFCLLMLWQGMCGI